jgi:hypothetical protein
MAEFSRLASNRSVNAIANPDLPVAVAPQITIKPAIDGNGTSVCKIDRLEGTRDIDFYSWFTPTINATGNVSKSAFKAFVL